MKFKPEYNQYRESPWILITLPETRRPTPEEINNNADVNNRETRKNRLSFGIHHLVTKNNVLNTASSTWPRPKMKKTKTRCSSEDVERPKTATLEHPKILDVAFLGKIDMTSLSKKSLMSIANLCILPIKPESKRNGGSFHGGRGAKTRRYTPLSSPTPRFKKVSSRFIASETTSESEDARSVLATPTPTPTPPGDKATLKTRPPIGADKELKKRAVITKRVSKNVDELFGRAINVIEPCTTCGRSDQPERLHSHPVPLGVATPRSEIQVKSSVRKPVPMRYRSDKTRSSEQEVLHQASGGCRKTTNNNNKVVVVETEEVPRKKHQDVLVLRTPEPTGKQRRREETAPPAEPVPNREMKQGTRQASGPRITMCYICGRGFGTTSFPLHEPQCMQRWQRENALLAPHLRRPAPTKPDKPITSEDWNRLAFEASQSQLVSCENCGRTFNPERLEVHQRSCRPSARKRFNQSHSQKSPDESETESADKSPSQPRRGVEPVKSDVSKACSPVHAPARPRSVPCYLCGRQFHTASISIHEPQCLKKWRIENEKLTPDRRRSEPQKPDVKYNANGQIDFQCTMDAIWESHLDQLVPCKHCRRTFNPDRVDVHERSCKGPKH